MLKKSKTKNDSAVDPNGTGYRSSRKPVTGETSMIERGPSQFDDVLSVEDD